MSEERESQDQEAPATVGSDAPDNDPAQTTDDPNTPFAITFFCLAIAALLLWFLPTYLSSYVGRIVLVLLYIVAGLIGLFGIFGFYVGLKERPALRTFLKGVLHGLLIKPLGAFGAPKEDAWTSVYFAAVLLAFDFVLHLVVISWIGASGIAEIIAKLVIFGLGILALIFITNAFDGFIVRPFLATLPRYQDGASLDALLQQIRKVVAATITIVGLILTLFEVF